MHDLNRVQLIGHVGHDPDVTYTATGTARTTFSVATSYHWKDTDGHVEEATEWTRCIAWGALRPVYGQRQPRLPSRAAAHGTLGGCRDRRAAAPRRTPEPARARDLWCVPPPA